MSGECVALGTKSKGVCSGIVSVVCIDGQTILNLPKNENLTVKSMIIGFVNKENQTAIDLGVELWKQ